MFSSSPSSSPSSSSSSTSSSSSSFPTISCVYLPASRSPCDMSYDCDMDINMDMNMNMNMNMEAIIPQDWTHHHDRDWEWDWKPRMEMEMMQLHNQTIVSADVDATSASVATSESTPCQQIPISIQAHTSADDLASPVYHATGMPISRCRALSMTQALYAQRLHQRSHAQVDEIDDDRTEKNIQIIHISKKHQACTTLAAMCWEGVAPSQRPQHIPSPVAKPLQLRRTATIPVDTLIPAITAPAASVAPAPAPASTTLSSSVSVAYHDLYHSDAHHRFPNLELDGNVSVDGSGTDADAAAASSSVSDAFTLSRSSQAPATCHLDFDVNDESDVEADDDADADADENRDVDSDSFDTDMSHNNPAWESNISHPHSYASSARTSPLSQSHMQWTSSDLEFEQQSSDGAAAEVEDEDEDEYEDKDENPTTDSLWKEFVLEPAIHVTSDKLKNQKHPTTPHTMKSLPTLIHTHNYRPVSYSKCQQSVDECQQTMATAVHVASGTSCDRGTGTSTGIMFPRLRSTTSFHHSPLARPICRTSSGMLPPLVFPSQLQHKLHHVQSTQWQAPTRPSTATATTAVIPPPTTILDMLRHRQDTHQHPHTLKHTQQEKGEVKVQDHSSIMIPSRPNTAVTGMGMGMRMGMGLGTRHTPTVYAQ